MKYSLDDGWRNKKQIVKSFKKCRISNAFDDTLDLLFENSTSDVEGVYTFVLDEFFGFDDEN